MEFAIWILEFHSSLFISLLHKFLTVKIGSIDLGEVPLFLAPMEDVTYRTFRHICKKNGADVVCTEFVQSDALVQDIWKTKEKIQLYESDGPVVGIQIYGHELESMVEAAKIAEKSQPSYIDLNYGCPMKKIVKKGAGSGMLRDLDKMQKITEEIVKTVSLPVTAKTRLGWDEDSKVVSEVAERLQDVGLSALAVHGRTRKMLYTGEADWYEIGKVKNSPRVKIPIIGNGDINGPERAAEFLKISGVDGLMLGRGAIGRPWIFNEIKHYLKTGELLPPPTVAEIIEKALDHLQMILDWREDERTTILMMRRHFAKYFAPLPDFRPFRIKLLQATEMEVVHQTLQKINEHYGDMRVDYTNASLK